MGWWNRNRWSIASVLATIRLGPNARHKDMAGSRPLYLRECLVACRLHGRIAQRLHVASEYKPSLHLPHGSCVATPLLRHLQVALVRLCYGDVSLEMVQAVADLAEGYAREGLWPQVRGVPGGSVARLSGGTGYLRLFSRRLKYSGAHTSAFRSLP